MQPRLVVQPNFNPSAAKSIHTRRARSCAPRGELLSRIELKNGDVGLTCSTVMLSMHSRRKTFARSTGSNYSEAANSCKAISAVSMTPSDLCSCRCPGDDLVWFTALVH